MLKSLFFKKVSVESKLSDKVLFGAVMIALAVALPATCHLLNLPVRFLLPMHWPVLIMGLALGPVAGILVGALSPMVSFALSGMPNPPFLLFMIFELAAYGFLTGLFHQTLKFNYVLSLIFALVLGRAIYLSVMALTIGVKDFSFLYIAIPSIIAQILLIPMIVKSLRK